MKKPTNIRILLLEDDLETVSLLSKELVRVEELLQEKGLEISLVVLSEYTMVQQYLNSLDIHQYQIVLLDRDCKAGGSFHVLDLNKFTKDYIISISSTPQWNEEAQEQGITRVVWKDFNNLVLFAIKAGKEIREILQLPSLSHEMQQEDELFPEAVRLVRNEQRASATFLQREFQIGYARAARLLDMLEEGGIIGPANENNPREVF